MNEQEVRKAIECVENFRDRYKEWANKDDTDFNVKAINVVIGKAKSLEPKVEEIAKLREALERIVKHHELIGPITKLSATYNIAKSALDRKE